MESYRRAQNATWFLDGEGIEHRVVQSDIPRYLGNDATVMRGSGPDGRHGYVYQAYRPLTSAMIRSLKEDSLRYNRERNNPHYTYRHHDLGTYYNASLPFSSPASLSEVETEKALGSSTQMWDG
ncbi:hypothetical protein BDD12DRAFT_821568 [Trichophaea hybrida]|nr:hypothetical protein BDD12DRAFT_821568 [Trichophaea hybrida]